MPVKRSRAASQEVAQPSRQAHATRLAKPRATILKTSFFKRFVRGLRSALPVRRTELQLDEAWTDLGMAQYAGRCAGCRLPRYGDVGELLVLIAEGATLGDPMDYRAR